jgi:hypothetical protein
LAVRLFSQSALNYNPADFIIYERINGFNYRYPGLYGRKSYELSNSCSLSKQDVESICKIYEVLNKFDENNNITEISFARDLFEQSFDIALNPLTKRTLLLLGTIEALADISNIWLLKNVKWNNDALKGFLKKYKSLRNILAHGKEINNDTVLSCLVTISRALLIEAIVYSVEDNSSTGNDILQLNLVQRLIQKSNNGLIFEKRLLSV